MANFTKYYFTLNQDGTFSINNMPPLELQTLIRTFRSLLENANFRQISWKVSEHLVFHVKRDFYVNGYEFVSYLR